MKRPTSVAVGFVILLFFHRSPSLIVAPGEQLDGSRWTLVAPCSTLLPSSEAPAALNRSENNISPFGAASYLNDAQSALVQTNKLFSSFLELFSSDAMTGMFLGSSAEGDMQLLRGSNRTFVEDLPTLDWMSSVSEIPSVTEMEWIDYYLEKEISQQLDYVAGASVYFGAKNIMAHAQLCPIAEDIRRDDLEAFCADQVEAGLAFYNSSINGNPLVNDTRLESNVKSASGVWRTVPYMSYTVVQKHLAFVETPSSGVDFGLRRAWALYWAATRPDCALYCNHDEATVPAALTPTPAPVVASGAYLDSPAIIPDTVEVFRLDEDVDIKPTPTSGFYVGWTTGGENLRHAVDIEIDGTRMTVSTMSALSAMLLLACLAELIIRRLLPHCRPVASTLPRVEPGKLKRMKAAKRGTGVETGYRKNAMTRKEDARMERRLRAEAYAHEKTIKAKQEALERQTLQREYKTKLAERRRDVREEKERKKQELANKKADVYEARERRVRDRALAAVAGRVEKQMVF